MDIIIHVHDHTARVLYLGQLKHLPGLTLDPQKLDLQKQKVHLPEIRIGL